MRERDHVDLQAVRHAGLLEVGPEGSVDQPDGGEVLYTGEADRLQLVEELVEDAEGVGAVDPASTGVRVVTGSTSLAISITISFALP